MTAKNPQVQSILARFGRAQFSQLARGRTWYPTARDLAADAIRGTSLDILQSVGSTAALSPRMRWDKNLAANRELVAALARGDDMPLVGIHRNVAKAWRILQGADPGEVLGGPKVRAFFRAMSGDVEAVTVDVWASRAADSDIPKNPREYDRLVAAYTLAADIAETSPRELQAITWLVEREEARYPGQLSLQIAV